MPEPCGCDHGLVWDPRVQGNVVPCPNGCPHEPEAKMLVLRMRRSAWWRLKWWSLTNWLHGYAFGPIKRCRKCKHTLYPSQRHCPYCEGWAYCTNSTACAFPGCPCSKRFEVPK